MAQKSARLAKLTPPGTGGIVERARLFEALDRVLHGRFAWISAPGGAGKTSLVASWLATRALASVWYQVDSGDRDPATLFHYLAVAAQAAQRRRRVTLPHFTPEYLAGLPQFARRFFRNFFAALTTPCVIVLDNCQEAGSDTPFTHVISSALNEVPSGIAVICVSRMEPGDIFARWTVEPSYVRLTWDDLKLDPAEAIAIAHQRGYRDQEAKTALETARGWAAGLVLTLRAHREGLLPSASSGDAQQALFDYFATEIVAAVDPREREFLLKTAVLPKIVPELAATLTGHEETGALLEELHRNRFFTDRHSGAGGAVSYEFHPLFKEFLDARAREVLGAEPYARLCKRAADLLDARGDSEGAVGLRIVARDWPQLAAAICTHAPRLMEQGRWQTLESWISAMPEAIVRGVPWLLYWRGACSCMHDPFTATDHLAAAYRKFRESGDSTGALLACAGVLEAYYFQFSEQQPARPWIDELNRLLAESPPLPAQIQVRVVQGLMAVWMACPEHPMLGPWAQRAIQLLREIPDERARLPLIGYITGYHIWAGQYPLVRAVLDEVVIDRRNDDTAPLTTIGACTFKAGIAWQDAAHEKAYELTDLAQAVVSESGVHVLDTVIAAQEIYTATSAYDVERARAALARARSLLDSRRKLDVHHYHSLHSGVLLIEGRIREALDVALGQLAISRELAAPFMTASMEIQCAELLMLDGRYKQGRDVVGEALRFARTMPSLILQFQALTIRAYADFHLGDEQQGYDALREALPIGRRQNFLNCHPWWIPRIMTFVLSRALEAGIEPEYVRRFVRHRQLNPDSAEVPGWPWPVRVYTLGSFRVMKQDEPLRAGRKAPRRVFELLQAIVALGPREASRERLTQALWPDAEGDAARDAFEIALHRLRKLVGEDAVLLEHGRVSLAAKAVWTDVEAFERLSDEVQQGSHGEAGQPRFERELDKALTLYLGDFLLNEPERPWLLPARERVRSKLERLVVDAGAQYESRGEITKAATLYRRAIELQPTGEGFYRRLIACYLKANENAQALEAYRRCRQMLSVVLGVAPSPETEALRASINE